MLLLIGNLLFRLDNTRLRQAVTPMVAVTYGIRPVARRTLD